MKPVFGRDGEVIAWISKGIIHDARGAAVAFLDKENVVNYGGSHLGILKLGLFRDHRGDVVAFLEHGSGGPVLPIPSIPPIPPTPGIPPISPIPPVPPIPAIPTLVWSRRTWQEFVEGR